MSTFLITGGAGFIGSNFCHYVVNKYPHDLFICYDALTYAGNINNLKELLSRQNFIFIRGNICDKNKLNKVFKKYKINIIINFAAETHVDRSIQSSKIFLKTNIQGTHTLLELAKKYAIEKFHQVSTDEVYGDLYSQESPATEESTLFPSNPYSATKAAADMLVLSYERTYHIPCTISRCSNNYGPYQNIEKFIPKIICNALKNKNIPIYGNGLNMRNWIYVLDHCIAVDRIARTKNTKTIYNISSNNEVTNLSLSKLILKILGKQESLLTFVDDRNGHDLRYNMSNIKIKQELKWESQYSLREGLQNTIEWYKNKKEE